MLPIRYHLGTSHLPPERLAFPSPSGVDGPPGQEAWRSYPKGTPQARSDQIRSGGAETLTGRRVPFSTRVWPDKRNGSRMHRCGAPEQTRRVGENGIVRERNGAPGRA